MGQAVATDSALLQYFLGITAKDRNKGAREYVLLAIQKTRQKS